MSKGFVILAQNTAETNYVKCAEMLAISIYRVMPDAKVSIITNNSVRRQLFHTIKKLPYGDLAPNSNWKLINDYQVYEASPYDYTIKLEADMFMPSSIDFWWDTLKSRDLVVCTTIRNYMQEVSSARDYRFFIDENKLPDCYNAITYFKKSELAETFFILVRDIFENWDQYKTLLKCNVDEVATTDWVYAIACHILGEEKTTLPQFKQMSMIHMKQAINNLHTEKWTDALAYEILTHTLRVNTIPQQYPFHYHVKEFAESLSRALE